MVRDQLYTLYVDTYTLVIHTKSCGFSHMIVVPMQDIGKLLILTHHGIDVIRTSFLPRIQSSTFYVIHFMQFVN